MKAKGIPWVLVFALLAGASAPSDAPKAEAGKVLFRDAFQDTSRWTWLAGKVGHPGWYLQGPRLAYWHPYSGGKAIARGMPVVSDAVIEITMWMQALRGYGRAGVYFRWDGRNGYLLSLSKNQTLVLRRVGLLAGPVARAPLNEGWSFLDGNQAWANRLSRLKIRAVGPHLQCFVDGQLVIDVTDSAYERGRIGLDSASSYSWFGELTVREPRARVPRKELPDARN